MNDNPTIRRSTAVEAFLAEAKAGAKPAIGTSRTAPAVRGRLIFGVDATASRQPTWDLATSITTEMFQEAGAIGGLDMQLVFFRGREFKAFEWVSDAPRLTRLMGSIHCKTGFTQITKVLSHTRAETAMRHVSALVFVGDALERTYDDPDVLHREALALGVAGSRTIMLQEGDSPEVKRGFQAIVQASGGAYAVFHPSTAQWLADILRGVARSAAGGTAALEARKDAASALLFTQMRK